MRLRHLSSALLLLLLPATAHAQDFGIMGSAETINRGNFKLMANPLLILQEGDVENDFGLGLLAGYGFTDQVDGEARVAFYDGVSYAGADLEYWFGRGEPVELSAMGGLHFGWGDLIDDTTGLDLALEGSGRVGDRLEVYTALDFAFNWLDFDDVPANAGRDDTFTTVHLVPGIEYRISPSVDFVGEIGIGLNDDSANYISAGIAYYVR